jgi:hypothetical protein
MSAGASTRPVRLSCEVARAFQELFGRPWPGTESGAAGCSPDVPERRDFPAPTRSGENYALCNGHLRDVFEAIALNAPAAPAPAALPRS